MKYYTGKKTNLGPNDIYVIEDGNKKFLTLLLLRNYITIPPMVLTGDTAVPVRLKLLLEFCLIA